MYPRSVDDVVSPAGELVRLGPYVVSPPMALGSLTTVHRAGAPNAEGTYAIKRLRPVYAEDAELRALLLATGRRAAALCAPNVVRVLEVREEPEPYLVMDYVDGPSLEVLLSAGLRTGEIRLVVPLLLDVLEGLRAVHELRASPGDSHGLVHCAPSARHIMVGRDGIARLVDLTHAVGEGLPWSARRDERLVPHEMAPEQALAPAHVDRRCDLFIVGAVLWRVLTGRSLFAAGDADESLGSMLRKPIHSPSEMGSRAGRGFDRICLRALQRSRAERYGSAAEMAAALRDEADRTGLLASRDEIAAWVHGVDAALAGLRSQTSTGSSGGVRVHPDEGRTLLEGTALSSTSTDFNRTWPIFRSAHPGSSLNVARGNAGSKMHALASASPNFAECAEYEVRHRLLETQHSDAQVAGSNARESDGLLPGALAGNPPVPELRTDVREGPAGWREAQPSLVPLMDSGPGAGRATKRAVAVGLMLGVVIPIGILSVARDLDAPPLTPTGAARRPDLGAPPREGPSATVEPAGVPFIPAAASPSSAAVVMDLKVSTSERVGSTFQKASALPLGVAEGTSLENAPAKSRRMQPRRRGTTVHRAPTAQEPTSEASMPRETGGHAPSAHEQPSEAANTQDHTVAAPPTQEVEWGWSAREQNHASGALPEPLPSNPY